jgi:hypothetical protein
MGTKRRNSIINRSSELDIAIKLAMKAGQCLIDLDHIVNIIFNTFAEYIISIHLKSVSNSKQAIIRFHNDYGVSILPLSSSIGRKFYEILVLRFHGSELNDYKIAQYDRVPEINWVLTDEEMLRVCRQVNLLRKREAGSFSLRIGV